MNPDELSFSDIGRLAAKRVKAALAGMVFPSRSEWSWPLRGTGTVVNYQRKVEPRGNAIVMAVIGWGQRTFPEAPLVIEKIGQDGQPDEVIPNHEMAQLIARPNPYYSGSLLWNATFADFLFGNAYWIIIPSKAGNALQLWWAPASQMEPRWPKDGKTYISHYDYTVDDETWRIPYDQVVHFRYGIDPSNSRKGLSPLGALFREIFTDNEAANWTAALLANGAVPGMVIAPENERVKISPDQADVMKTLAMQKFGGDKRGEPMVLSHAAKVFQAAWNPQQMNLRDLRKIPEERVTSVIGTPAVVVGLGAGLDRATFANMAEAREAAYESFMIPTKGLLADELNVQLLPRFADPAKFRTAWDYSKVRVLQEDEDKKHARAREDFKAGGMMLDEFREAIGLPPLPKKQGQLFAVPINLVLTPAEELWTEPEPVPAALAGGSQPAALPPGQAGDGNPSGPSSTGPNSSEGQGAGASTSQEPAKSKRLVLVESKSVSERSAQRLTVIRNRMAVKAERSVAKYLTEQRRKITAAILRYDKAIDVADVFDSNEADASLRAVLEAWYSRTLIAQHSAVESMLDVSFELDDQVTRTYLAEAGTNIRNITQTTLTAVRTALQEGQSLGEGVGELANRIKDLPEFGRARATTIARTELGHASNTAAKYTYTASGLVVGVQVFDGEEHEECAKWNGRKFPLSQLDSIPTLAHPNCVRAFGAIVDASELEGAA